MTDPAACWLGSACECFSTFGAAGGSEGVIWDGREAEDDIVDCIDVEPLSLTSLLEPGLEEGLTEPSGCCLAAGHYGASLDLDLSLGVVAVNSNTSEEIGQLG